ncbi:hypothetical protein CBR_g37431 [Chara braunii]|uniref:BTB domain-containing protein n=1 Tax=Chara braunii TaxID=69332 RepID=A0A388LMT0_CHABU|nr:hypothetical protein CBR_g37431 [Chara braunii]|eukprot:GBG83628.1 hypothetical protein CBR_g37431 [Chara braunii]
MGQQGDHPSDHISTESDVQILKLLACNFVNKDKQIVLGGTFEGNDMHAEDRGSSKFIPIDRLQADGFVVADTLIVGAGISRAQWSSLGASVDENCMIELPVIDAGMSNCSRFFNKQAMSDVEVIASTGERFYGHRIVLAQQSRPFCALFEKEGQEGNRQVQLLEANGTVLGAFLKYLYGCSAQVDVKNIVGLCTLAERFEVDKLHAICLSEIRRYFEIPKVTFKDTCEFVNLGLEDIHRMVSSQLRPISEKVLIDAILKWAGQVPERLLHLESLMLNVTFHALSAKEMIEVRRLPVVSQSTALMNLLLDAYEALWASHCGVVDLLNASLVHDGDVGGNARGQQASLPMPVLDGPVLDERGAGALRT